MYHTDRDENEKEHAFEHGHTHDCWYSNIHAVENITRTIAVIALTAAAMAAEIVYGYFTHSMALLSDGWHMGPHALALRGLRWPRRLIDRLFVWESQHCFKSYVSEQERLHLQPEMRRHE